jgi:hypothetical protein
VGEGVHDHISANTIAHTDINSNCLENALLKEGLFSPGFTEKFKVPKYTKFLQCMYKITQNIFDIP